MATRTRVSFLFLLPVSLAASCGGVPTGPPGADDVKIIVHTTGGIAALDWTVTLDGADGEARCSEPCPWAPESTRVVSDVEVEAIAAAFVDAGIRRARETDFGRCALCADQFHHEIVYRDRTGLHHVAGDGPNFPNALEAAVAKIIFPTSPE